MFASSVFVRPLITALPLAAALLIACGDAHETTDDATGGGTETGDDTDDAATTEGTTDDATTTEGATTDDATT
ncbi:MAG: hypothetical protein KC636_28970, partial [Myxococcales bacterium]|nr:hypothetical protein [Myxococcales bacterium]